MSEASKIDEERQQCIRYILSVSLYDHRVIIIITSMSNNENIRMDTMTSPGHSQPHVIYTNPLPPSSDYSTKGLAPLTSM